MCAAQLASAFIGTWSDPNDYISEIEYTVSASNDGISIIAVDPSNGEKAKISDIDLQPERLMFTALWSSGQITNCCLEYLNDTQLSLTFTYTDKAILTKKKQ